jgi:hypothetical protein
MTTYQTAAEFGGDPRAVLDSAIATLTHNGFAITQRDAASASLTGPGLTSTKQNAILGASHVLLNVRGNRLEAQAELGGVDRMQRFLMRFPFLLALAIGLFLGVGGGLFFGAQTGAGFGAPWAPGWSWLLVTLGISMLAVSPWFVLSPLMSRAMRNRTQTALETLVRNAVFQQRANSN